MGEIFAKHISNPVLILTTFKKFNREAKKEVSQLKCKISVYQCLSKWVKCVYLYNVLLFRIKMNYPLICSNMD